MKNKYIKWGIAAIATTAAGLLLDSLILEKYFFEVKEFEIGKEEGKDMVRIVLLTDLHFKDLLLPHFTKLAQKLNEIQPDLLLIAGDILDSSGHIQPADAFFDLLNPAIRIVAIPGNNDYKADIQIPELQKALEKYNCDFLLNKSKAYEVRGNSIMITGLDDFIESEDHFAKAVKDVGYEENHLLLIHSPLQQKHVKEQIKRINSSRSPDRQLNISYIFAGHTHGGQVRLPGYVPILPGKSGNYVNGWYNEHAPYLYVSKGFGTSTIPFRFFAKSEMIVLNYHV
ncbi:metallophosphoesterase [Pontibacter sp. MBLB2868]|uniref:metallophosphoesterase n=1 Tax=Pontibacter sp. MBLB2868 TaxID=3451555 RepID=UPI003F74FA93